MMAAPDRISREMGFSPPHPPIKDRNLKTPEGEKDAKPLTGHSTCAVVALIILDIACIVIVALGAIHIFGPLGSTGFIASLAVGSSVATLATGGIIWIAIANCKDDKVEAPPHAPLTPAQTKVQDDTNATEEATSDTAQDKNEDSKKTNQFPYTECGQQAITFGRQKLEAKPPKQFWQIEYEFLSSGSEKLYQPINPEIRNLRELYSDADYAFEERIKLYPYTYLWTNELVTGAADDCLKLAYAICSLALDDLPDFIKSVAPKGHTWSPTEAITHEKSYLPKTFLLFSKLYHQVRGDAAWISTLISAEIHCLRFPQQKISEEHEKLFYQEGTLHSQWRALYNDFCDRVRLYVPESDLAAVCEKGDVRWIQKDEGPETFCRL